MDDFVDYGKGKTQFFCEPRGEKVRLALLYDDHLEERLTGRAHFLDVKEFKTYLDYSLAYRKSVLVRFLNRQRLDAEDIGLNGWVIKSHTRRFIVKMSLWIPTRNEEDEESQKTFLVAFTIKGSEPIDIDTLISEEFIEQRKSQGGPGFLFDKGDLLYTLTDDGEFNTGIKGALLKSRYR